MTDRNLAQEIVVTSTPGKSYSLTIDGQEFPWWIDANGINLQVNDNEVPGITIRIIANSVRVEHRID